MKVSLRVFAWDPEHDLGSVWFGVVFALVGLLLAGGAVVHLASQPWDLATVGVEAPGSPAGYSPWVGDRYAIDVGGSRYTCHRGQSKVPAYGRATPILYDPRAPARCRARDTASRPGDYEATSLVVGSAFALVGLAFVLAYLAEPRPEWVRAQEGEPASATTTRSSARASAGC
ncbi:MAG: hypothetical protein H6713_35145 [Myxococcales bacterium]|nr:hypothetical protein [Myxococcales bacterium]